MTIEQWTPATQTPDISSELLLQLTNLSQTWAANPEQIPELPDGLNSTARNWLQHSEQHWQQAIRALTPEQQIDLAFFYVLAEMKLSGWESKDKNPAIWIFRQLKAQQQLPEKATIKYLKSLTDNRFIPYGSVL